MTRKERGTDAGSMRSSREAAPSALATITGLMEERRRLESWIAALEAKRDRTPPRVFTRVHADYTTRLDAVVGQITQNADGLRAEVVNLTAQLAAADEEQQLLRDERAEAELRAQVGELSPKEWEATARVADERIDALTSRHADLATELLRAREMLADSDRSVAPRRPSGAVPAAMVRDAEAEAVVSASVEAASTNVAPASGDEAPASGDEVSDQSEAALHVPTADGSTDDTAADDAIPEEVSPSVIAAEAQLMGNAPPARASAFDELAFLNSVVETPAIPAERAPAGDAVEKPPQRATIELRSKEGAIENRDATADTSILARPTKRGTPMGANVSGNNPIVLRDKPAGSAKTLKCADCSAMNYPTEWYCERCGAELASL